MFKDVIYNANNEILMIPIQRAGKDRKKVDVAVFNLDRFAEDTL